MTQENRRMMMAYRTARSESFGDTQSAQAPPEDNGRNDPAHLSRRYGVTFATMLEYRDWTMTLRPLLTLLAQRETSR